LNLDLLNPDLLNPLRSSGSTITAISSVDCRSTVVEAFRTGPQTNNSLASPGTSALGAVPDAAGGPT